jgi:cytoskeletal protein CcmA (bactofilin family)
MTRWRKSEDMVGGFLDNGTEVTGELQFSNTLRIDGTFHGSIIGEDRLIIGEQAVIHADIKVGDIEIRGQVYGKVEVQRHAEILSTGLLRGDIHSAVLIIQAGATFEGRSHKLGSVPQASDQNGPNQPASKGTTAESLIQ